jgi:hypothetical protein
MLNNAAQAELGEYSPLDCHCDIPMDVAFVLGFYAGVADRGGHGDASGMSTLEMIHHDIEILLKEMISREIEARRLVKAS